MKLYTTPGGRWAGTEKDWIAALKAEGINPKTYTGRSRIEVPVDKAGLMEFLTFYNVNVINPGHAPVQVDAAGGAPPPAAPPAAPDLDALRALHNPEGAPPALPAPTTVPDLDALFEAAPLARQLHLAALACENARERIS